VTSDPDFKVTTFFEVEYLKNGASYRDKVTHTNRKPYLTYRMVLTNRMFGDLD